MNAPTRTGRARLLFAAILTGAVVAAGMAPALATSSPVPVEHLGELAEVLKAKSLEGADRLEVTVAWLDGLSGIVPDDPGRGDREAGGDVTT